ncbi:MAG TPA: lipopolysaccharide heptosyltransferase I [Candidatus Limnocylindrales bacterium]|nr:lipopolysaccharide heptosyltransferase I [Candidatus Limnocylindrales bacterium]
MRSPDIRRILIVKLSALGDIAHALPASDSLVRAAPGAQVDWAVDRRFAGLLDGHPGLRRVVPLDLKRWKREWSTSAARREASGAVRSLREGKYDVAFDLQGNAKSGVVTRLSGAPLRYGFDRDGAREAPNLLFTNRKVALRAGDRHISQKILRIVSAPFGGEFDLSGLRSGFVPTEEQMRHAARVLGDIFPMSAPLVVVHAGTTWRTKRMDPVFWAEALRALRSGFPRMGALLSWGTEEERREAEEIREDAGGGVELLPKLTLGELAAVYRRCGYLMAPDTGPLHVAAAAGAKTVSVFRVTDGNRNAPFGPGHRFLQAPMPCTACLRKRCGRDAECRRSISPAAVAEAMAALIG